MQTLDLTNPSPEKMLQAVQKFHLMVLERYPQTNNQELMDKINQAKTPQEITQLMKPVMELIRKPPQTS